jgi:diguanylate cyclase (GGDEF)-like protein
MKLNFPETKRPLILVTDDDPVMRKMICRRMKQDGYRVIEASNGQECLDVYQQESPDLILLDAMMPVMDGFTCCQILSKMIRADHQRRKSDYLEDHSALNQTDQILASIERTPILMVTGLDDTESVDYAFEMGATDFIRKPIHWAVLRQRVRRLIQQSNLYQQLEIANAELKRMAILDGLTQLANRRYFDEYLETQWKIMEQKQLPIALILCDIDFFKLYNDTYGHQDGDTCLKQIAKALTEEVKRVSDLVARYGGEEMAIILPDTNSQGAFFVAQNIRERVKSFQLQHSASPINQYVTLSLGVASVIPSPHNSPENLIKEADDALYLAKQNGRDRTILYTITHN